MTFMSSSRPWTRNLSAPLRYAKRPRRSCAIRCGVWGPLAVITSSRTIFFPTYWTPLYSHTPLQMCLRIAYRSKHKGLVRRFFRMSVPALHITGPPSPPSSSGPTSTREWLFFLRFPFLSLEHAAFSALQPKEKAIQGRPRRRLNGRQPRRRLNGRQPRRRLNGRQPKCTLNERKLRPNLVLRGPNVFFDMVLGGRSSRLRPYKPLLRSWPSRTRSQPRPLPQLPRNRSWVHYREALTHRNWRHSSVHMYFSVY
jgi:hypothetical protein